MARPVRRVRLLARQSRRAHWNRRLELLTQGRIDTQCRKYAAEGHTEDQCRASVAAAAQAARAETERRGPESLHGHHDFRAGYVFLFAGLRALIMARD